MSIDTSKLGPTKVATNSSYVNKIAFWKESDTTFKVLKLMLILLIPLAYVADIIKGNKPTPEKSIGIAKTQPINSIEKKDFSKLLYIHGIVCVISIGIFAYYNSYLNDGSLYQILLNHKFDNENTGSLIKGCLKGRGYIRDIYPDIPLDDIVVSCFLSPFPI